MSGFIHTDDGTLVAGQPRRRRHLVPGERSPERQGLVHLPHHRPRGAGGGRQRCAQGRADETRLDDLDVGRKGAHGLVPDHGDDRRVRPSRLQGGRVSASGTRSTRTCSTPWPSREPAASSPSRSRPSRPTSGWLARSRFRPAERRSPSGSRATPSSNWDFVFVEAHAPGQDDWTTLRDANGHTDQNTGFVCPFWLSLHPFLEHYQTDNGDDTCSPEGTTGDWWAASGSSGGYEQWLVDLSRLRGRRRRGIHLVRERRLVQLPGAFVDDIAVSTGEGTTSFEDDGNTFDGWTVPGAPAGSEPNDNDWIAGTAADTPPPLGDAVEQSFARQPEIIEFESSMFGDYPFSAGGGIVDDSGHRVRARDADPSDLREGLLHRSGAGRLRDRARARPSVVRRQPRLGSVAAHLAQRGVRDLRRVALGRARGLCDGAGDLRRELLRHPRG